MSTEENFEYRTATKPMVEQACQLVVDAYDKLVQENKVTSDQMPSEIAFCKAALLDEKKRKETIANAQTPQEHEYWEHRNGKVYEILFIANQNNKPDTHYEPHVVYQNIESKTVWSRPLSDWHRSFGLKPIPFAKKQEKSKATIKP
jgi:hypothetical protein